MIRPNFLCHNVDLYLMVTDAVIVQVKYKLEIILLFEKKKKLSYVTAKCAMISPSLFIANITNEMFFLD